MHISRSLTKKEIIQRLAVKRMIKRSIDRYEVEESVLSGEIIEEYPDDKYSPKLSYLWKNEKWKRLTRSNFTTACCGSYYNL